MRKNVKKLVLSKETIRSLQDSELAGVAGGEGQAPTGLCPITPTCGCPTGVAWCVRMPEVGGGSAIPDHCLMER